MRHSNKYTTENAFVYDFSMYLSNIFSFFHLKLRLFYYPLKTLEVSFKFNDGTRKLNILKCTAQLL